MQNCLIPTKKLEFKEIEKLINKDFSWIVWYMFLYDENWFNEKLFKNFLWLNLKNYENSEDFLDDAKISLNKKIEEFEKLIKNIKNDDLKLKDEKNYILKNLEESLEFVKNLENIILIETQKIKKFNFKIDKNELKNILQKIENFEKNIYSEKLSENPVYSLEIIENLEKDFLKAKDKLSEDEIIFMEKILFILREKTGNIWKKFEEKNKIKNLPESLENNKILEKEIERDDYAKIFKLVLDILGFCDIKVEIDEKVWNFSASSEKIRIPANNEYKSLKISKIIDLISHEIETHLVTHKNNQNLVWFVKPIWYQSKEEWIASTFWMLASGKNLQEIAKPGKAIYQVLFCEVISWKENLEKFLEINKKLFLELKIDIEKRIERLKRWKDFDEVWVNPKEKSYFLWRRQVVEKINNKENILNLFIWKNSFEMEQDLAQIIGKDFSLENFREKWIILPLMIWEILRYKLLTEKEDNKGLLWGFLKYFNNKYWQIFDNLWINYKDFVKNYISAEKEENKKRIKEILELFLK